MLTGDQLSLDKQDKTHKCILWVRPMGSETIERRLTALLQ